MRLVTISRVAEGMELARDVISGRPNELPMLRSGVRLTANLAQRLATSGVHAVWIEDELGEMIEPVEPLSPEVRAQTQKAAIEALDSARDALRRGQPIPDDVVAKVAATAAAIARAIVDCPEAAHALDDLAAADTYTYRHSLRVTTLGLLIAHRVLREDGWVDWAGRRRYDEIEERLTTLGTGLLIHDIGKLAIPHEILNKPHTLTPEEYELVKTHPEAGVEMLPSDRMSSLVLAVVRSHHERWDGLGYPHGKAGDRIHLFARIAAPADVYDAITSDRPYKKAAPPHVGVRAVVEGAGTQFDPKIVEHFQRVVMPYAVGHEITLPDGQIGVVAAVDPERPYFPTIRVRQESGTIDEAVIDMTEAAACPADEIAPPNAPVVTPAPDSTPATAPQQQPLSAA